MYDRYVEEMAGRIHKGETTEGGEMAKTLKDKGEEKKELSDRINELLYQRHIEHPDAPLPGINWRFLTAQQMRKTVKLLEEL